MGIGRMADWEIGGLEDFGIWNSRFGILDLEFKKAPIGAFFGVGCIPTESG
jgi:hypothetical protein